MDYLPELLPRIAEAPFGLFTDIDGTISEIVPAPGDATVLPRCRRALQALVDKLALVAVVTGRDVETARRMVDVDGLIYVGNHGLERWQEGKLSVEPRAEQYRGRIAEAARDLRRLLTLPGVYVEEKGVGLSVHYRHAEDWEVARSAILSVLEKLEVGEWLLAHPGRAVVNFQVPIDVDKGTAIHSLAREFGLRGALFLGDDVGDIDGFHALRRLAREGDFLGVSVAVLGDETPEEVRREATHWLNGVGQVEEFLTTLANYLEPLV